MCHLFLTFVIITQVQLKKLFAILAITGILLQTFYSSIIVINYQLNKEYIAKNLCENKNKPMMHCNGKCHLKKQLANQEKQDGIPNQNLKEKLELRVCHSISLIAFPEFTAQNEANFSYSFFIPQVSLRSVFHPPRVA